MDLIKEGDRVNIHFEFPNSLYDVEILHISCAVGDCWTVKDSLGNISNVLIFSRMDKLPIIESEKDRANIAWDE